MEIGHVQDRPFLNQKLRQSQLHGAALTKTTPPPFFSHPLLRRPNSNDGRIHRPVVEPPGGGAASDPDGSRRSPARFDGRIADALTRRRCRRHLCPRHVVIFVVFTPFCIIKASLAVRYRRGPWSPSRQGRHITYSSSCACSRRGGRGGGGTQAVDRMRAKTMTTVVTMGLEMTTGETLGYSMETTESGWQGYVAPGG